MEGPQDLIHRFKRSLASLQSILEHFSPSSELKSVFSSFRHASIPSTRCQNYYVGSSMSKHHYRVNFLLSSTTTLSAECPAWLKGHE